MEVSGRAKVRKGDPHLFVFVLFFSMVFSFHTRSYRICSTFIYPVRGLFKQRLSGEGPPRPNGFFPRRKKKRTGRTRSRKKTVFPLPLLCRPPLCFTFSGDKYSSGLPAGMDEGSEKGFPSGRLPSGPAAPPQERSVRKKYFPFGPQSSPVAPLQKKDLSVKNPLRLPIRPAEVQIFIFLICSA